MSMWFHWDPDHICERCNGGPIKYRFCPKCGSDDTGWNPRTHISNCGKCGHTWLNKNDEDFKPHDWNSELKKEGNDARK